MTGWLRALASAAALLTTLPIPARWSADANPGRAALCYPLVGLGLGGVLAALAWALAGQPPAVAGAVVLIVWVLATGALHLDGLADCADAAMARPGDAQRAREIMRDPHSGAGAVVAVTLVLIARFAALHALCAAHTGPAVWLVPALGRTAILALMLALPYANPAGMGAGAHSALPRRAAWIVVGVGIAAAALTSPAGLIGAALTLTALAHWSRRTVHGATGDVYGAGVELMEVALLLALAAGA